MYTLGIETSCDETSASIVKDGSEVLSNSTASSLRFHKKYGGVIPEIAFRTQLDTIASVVDCAFRDSSLTLKEIGLIGVTEGPGLQGSLLIGISFAQALSLSASIPLIGINHLYGHIYANFLGSAKPRFPCIALVVSGGHTSLFYLRNFATILQIGSTQDDAAGEAFDKVAKILGLGYPGGPLIEKLSQRGDPHAIQFRCSNTKSELDFSFSGIKTAVLYYARDHGYCRANESFIAKGPDGALSDIAASFQESIITALLKKALLACRLKRVNHLVVAGGVAANKRLRNNFLEAAAYNGITCDFPPTQWCMDNAAMIAGFAYQRYRTEKKGSLGMTLRLS